LFNVSKVAFNYETETWAAREYYLPALRNDFVLLTPIDMLTRDETWISHSDMHHQFSSLPDAIPNIQLRGQINNYLRSLLGKRPTEPERRAAEQATILKFPQLIDYYIAMKEAEGDRAMSVSSQAVADAASVFVYQVRSLLVDLEAKTDFYKKNWTSYDEALERVLLFKHYVEHQDGYRLINWKGRPFASEEEVHIFFGLVWCKTDFDINREVNNGRGPVDFKVSYGSGDKSLIEFKLASNTSLKRNLQKQVEIYQDANRARKTVKVIICYTAADQERVSAILGALKIENEPSIVVIDARSDNKPSASKA
jgi:hypothetical protein